MDTFGHKTYYAALARRVIGIIENGQVVCSRCSGTGVWANRGRCYRCGGDGVDPKPSANPKTRAKRNESARLWAEKWLPNGTDATA